MMRRVGFLAGVLKCQSNKRHFQETYTYPLETLSRVDVRVWSSSGSITLTVFLRLMVGLASGV